MIRVESFTKVYDRQVAVDQLEFEVAAGEILGLVGPNGAGKTTTLRSIAGILQPTEGTVTVDGFDVVKRPLEAKKRLAIIPDDPCLFESLTVEEHLVLTARIYRLTDWEPAARHWLETLELTERRDRMADQLSRGMRQKVAVACALLHEPAALLLDEPLTGLDPRGIRTLYSALRECAARGAAVILSSHLLGQIETLCTKFLILHQGTKIAYGSKADIRTALANLREDASLEEIFFEAIEGGSRSARIQEGAVADSPVAGSSSAGGPVAGSSAAERAPAEGSADSPETPA